MLDFKFCLFAQALLLTTCTILYSSSKTAFVFTILCINLSLEGSSNLNIAVNAERLNFACSQVVEASNVTLMAAETTAEQGILDLPNSCLLSNGYECLAQEGGITVSIGASEGREICEPSIISAWLFW